MDTNTMTNNFQRSEWSFEKAFVGERQNGLIADTQHNVSLNQTRTNTNDDYSDKLGQKK